MPPRRSASTSASYSIAAIGARFYGRVMIEIHFEGGRPVLISRRIEGVDK